ncbi:hypothetical protein CN489_16190 [Bacillus cereus]|nr:hypothetical protein CN489_16190 [Bacillus cereus]
MELCFFIHFYPSAFLGLLFVTDLAQKLNKILHALSVGSQKIWCYPLHIKKRAPTLIDALNLIRS